MRDFKYFINSEDRYNSLSVTYSTKLGLYCTETYSHPKIKECPFCGSSAHLKTADSFGIPDARVVCDKCHNGTSRFHIGKHIMPDVNYSFQDVINKSIELWNNRAYTEVVQ